MEEDPNRAEAIRLLGIAEKLLQSRDLNGARDFAVLVQETDPLLEGSDQILAVIEVLLTADKRINSYHDWYSILQLDRRSDDLDVIKKQYRRLALLLHPDKNKFPYADQAFKLVTDAWAVLSKNSKKSLYDKEVSLFTKVDLGGIDHTKLPVRRGQTQESQQPSKKSNSSRKGSETGDNVRLSTFWTACPYCYRLFEYPRVYEGCCLRCQNCERAFHAVLIPTLPPLVPGKEAYYCCWGLFPLGYMLGNVGDSVKAAAGVGGFPNWMPPMFSAAQQPQGERTNDGGGGGAVRTNKGTTVDVLDKSVSEGAPKKRGRGRPRKNA